MYWQYEIKKDENGYFLAEVYYEDGEEAGYTEPLTEYYESKKALHEALKMMLKDVNRQLRNKK